MKVLQETALTYDDVLLVPQYSDVDSRRILSTQTRLTNQIMLQIPIVSANMDVVTEYEMAIAMAREGGIGIIHRFLSIDEQGITQLIFAVQNDAGRLWRFSTGTVTGNRLTFAPYYGRPARLVDWSDANSGSVGSLAGDNQNRVGQSANVVRTARFKRLDGVKLA